MRTKTFLIICVLAIHSKRLKAGDDALPSQSPIYQQEKDLNPFNLSKEEFFRVFASFKILERKHPDKSRKEILEKYKKKEEDTLKELSEEGLEFIKSNLKEVNANLVEFEKFKTGLLKKIKVSNKKLDRGFRLVKNASNLTPLSDEIKGLSNEVKRLFEEITNYVSEVPGKSLTHLEENRHKSKKVEEYEQLRTNEIPLNELLEQKITNFQEKVDSKKEKIYEIQKNRIETIGYWLDKLNNDPENETKKIEKIIKQEIAKRKEEKNAEKQSKQDIEDKEPKFTDELSTAPKLDKPDLDEQLNKGKLSK